jgi:hypothetical protein
VTDRIAKLFPDWPEWNRFWSTLELGREGKAIWICGIAALLLVSIWFYRRDTLELSRFWRVWLTTLRGLVVLVLLVIAMVPQERIARKITQSSRVVFLIDTSLSMSEPEKEPATDRSSAANETDRAAASRAAAVQNLFDKSPLIGTLRKTHDVLVYTFDSRLSPEPALISRLTPPTEDAAKAPKKPEAVASKQPAAAPDWSKLVQPRGTETRLGESLLDLVRREASETLAGIVLVGDGRSNAGAEPLVAVAAAKNAKVPLHAVGVGSPRPQANLKLAGVQLPSHAHLGDGFKIQSFVVGENVSSQTVQVDLYRKREGADWEPEPIQSREILLTEDGREEPVSFDFLPRELGRTELRLRVRPLQGSVRERTELDNVEQRSVDITDRKLKVLVVASGPMRDYQFVRNLLHRDSGVEMDVWLQTGSVGISQESANLIFSFPDSREELFKYDVLIAFDPDWRKIPSEMYPHLSEWVFGQAGGLILVAGDVYTPQLASASDAVRQEMEKLFELYPVVFDAHPFDFNDEDFKQPWPVDLTREGQEVAFLQLTDDPASSAGIWKQFPGIFRCYPTDGPKAGATVYARFSDPRVANEPPILLAAQYYGAGRVLYLGSAETWLLRALEEDYYDRLWIKAIREVGQGRLKRGTNRGVLLLENEKYTLGASVHVRARVLDQQFQPLVAERVTLEAYDPAGRRIPDVDLTADKNHPGLFVGEFVVNQQGPWRLELPVPDSNDRLKGEVSVSIPNLESQHPEQNVELLKTLARDTGGEYVSLDEAAARLPGLLPDRTIEKLQYDFPRTLWDQRWVMWLLVALLGVEWLTRKLLKLA